MDLSKLSIEQLQLADKILGQTEKWGLNSSQQLVALKVAERAQKYGLNPSFVLPLVMAESGFKQEARSPKGAIGVMQLMPDTAKGLKADPTNIDENIDGGMRLLKELVDDKRIGNDPLKVLVAYNTSSETRGKFFEEQNLSRLPLETLNYIDKMYELSGDKLANVLGGEARAEEGASGEAVEPSDDGERLEAQDTRDVPGAAQEIRAAIGPIAGYAGLGATAGMETTRKLAPLVPNLINAALPGRQVNPAQPMPRWGLQRYLSSQIPENLRMTVSDLEKASGSKIRTMSEVQKALASIQKVETQRVAKTTSVDPKTGTPRKIYTTTPGRAPVDLSQFEVKPSGPVSAAVGRELTAAGETVRSLAPSVARVGFGGLGAASSAMTGYDTYELYNKIRNMREQGQQPSMRDLARLGTKGAATLGGAMSVIPSGVTQVGGLVLSAPELAWSGYEGLRNASRGVTKEQAERALTNVDIMGNPIGGLP